MTTEIWRVHILWIFQITKITCAKSPIQNCLSGGFQERVGIIPFGYQKSENPLFIGAFGLFILIGDFLQYFLGIRCQFSKICLADDKRQS